MKKGFIVLGIISALALTLILLAGCKSNAAPKPIGGDKDAQGCLVSAGYSWDENVTACIRPWELDDSQKKAAQIAVAPISARPVTIIEVIKARCPGCFEVKLKTTATSEPATVTIMNWTISEGNECEKDTKTCPDGVILSREPDHGCEFRSCPKPAQPAQDLSEEKESAPVQMANPASTKCIEDGGKLDIVTAEDGSQSGVCTLPDGTQCDEWTYFRGECPKR